MDDKMSVEELSQKLWDEQTVEGWDDVFRTNVHSIFYMTVAFLPLLQKFTNGTDPAGRAIYERYQSVVINTTSISGLIKKAQNHFACEFVVPRDRLVETDPLLSIDNASKGAANHLQRLMATEFAHTGCVSLVLTGNDPLTRPIPPACASTRSLQASSRQR